MSTRVKARLVGVALVMAVVAPDAAGELKDG